MNYKTKGTNVFTLHVLLWFSLMNSTKNPMFRRWVSLL